MPTTKQYPQGTVSPALPTDLTSITPIIHAAYSPYIARLNGKQPAPMTADYASLIQTGELYVLRLPSNTIAGCISLHSNAANHALEINNLAVGPEYQGRGFGRLLMGFAEDVARDRGVQVLELYTNVKMVENIGLYAKLGFENVGVRTEHGFERVFFKKQVGSG